MNEQYKTFEQWNLENRHINRGEKAKQINGQLVFTKSQTYDRSFPHVKWNGILITGPWDDMPT